MTTQVTLQSDGSTTSSQTGYASSADYQSEGIVARSGIGSRTVADHTRLDENELINIGGMELKVSQARDMGLIGAHAPDEGLSAASAAQRTPEAAPKADTGTGHEAYDATVSELNAQVEAGQMDNGEANLYSTALGAVALAGLTVTEVSDTIDGLADGSVELTDLDQNQRDIVQNLQSTVTDAATKSAMKELGQDGFNRLAEMAKGSAELNAYLRHYASLRALGKADVSWAEFYQDAEAFSRGER